MRKKRVILITVAMLGGCATVGEQVYIASDTVLGVSGATNTAQTSGKLIVGYDRRFTAYVPKLQDDNESDAMAIFNCTHLEVKGIRISKFYEHIATGDAAKALASKIDSVDKASCRFGVDAKTNSNQGGTK